MALIAGTAVGGGCLAIPASTADAGFVPSSAALVFVWATLCANGLLLVEVAIGVHRRTGRHHVPMQVMAETTLGRRWGRILAACYAVAVNATLTGQLSKGAFVLTSTRRAGRGAGGLSVDDGSHAEGIVVGDASDDGIGLNYWIAVLSLSCVVAAPCFLAGDGGRMAENLNAGATATLVLAFGCLLVAASAHVDADRVTHNLSFSSWAAVPAAVPAVTQVLSFAQVIPVACQTLRFDPFKCAVAVSVGSAVPLGLVLVWNAAAVVLAPPAFDGGGRRDGRSRSDPAMDPVNVLLSRGGALEENITFVFAMSAVLTTLIGSYLSLSEFFSELFSNDAGHTEGAVEIEMTGIADTAKEHAARRTALSGLSDALDGGAGTSWFSSNKARMVCAATTLPSVAVACVGPQVFYEVIRFSGSFIVPTLFCVAPPAMAWAMRYHRARDPVGGAPSPREAAAAGESTCGCEGFFGSNACVPGRAGGLLEALMLDAPPWPFASEAAEWGYEPAPMIVPGGGYALVALGGSAALWVLYLALQPFTRIHIHT